MENPIDTKPAADIVLDGQSQDSNTEMFIEVLLESGALQVAASATKELLSTAAHKFADWIASELYTPTNSQKPTVQFSEPGPWNGIVLVEASQPVYWALAKGGPDRDKEEIPQAETRHSTTGPATGPARANPYGVGNFGERPNYDARPAYEPRAREDQTLYESLYDKPWKPQPAGYNSPFAEEDAWKRY